jgi:hypothetical protein
MVEEDGTGILEVIHEGSEGAGDEFGAWSPRTGSVGRGVGKKPRMSKPRKKSKKTW